eukprot:IDg19584t1
MHQRHCDRKLKVKIVVESAFDFDDPHHCQQWLNRVVLKLYTTEYYAIKFKMFPLGPRCVLNIGRRRPDLLGTGQLVVLFATETVVMSGVSDEEIMSDGAADGFSDDDFGLGKGAAGEGLMLTDLLDLKTKKDATAQKSSQPQVSKGEITARAKILRSTRKKKAAAQETALVPLLHSDSESDHSDVADDADDNDGDDDDDDDEALRSVVKAATGRDLRARQARTNAVTVTQGVGAEDILAAPVARERSGRETLDRCLACWRTAPTASPLVL